VNGSNPASGLLTVAFIVLLPMTIGGCGFMFVHGPPAGHQQMQSFNCTQGNAGPIVDVALAGLGGALAVWAAHQAHYDSYYYYVSDDLAAAGIAAAVLYGSSAIVGFFKTKKCRVATQQLEERVPQVQQEGGDKLAPPPQWQVPSG
jgi:hypothetical protein